MVGGQRRSDAVANRRAQLTGGIGPGVAAGVYAGNARPHVDVGIHVAQSVHLQQSLQVFRVGMKADVNKRGGGRVVVDLFRLQVLDPGVLQHLVAGELLHNVAPQEFHLFVVEGPFLKDPGGPELVTAVYVSNGVDYSSQVVPFVHGGVAPAHDHHILPAEEIAVANGAVGYAPSGIRVLPGHSQLVVRAAGSDYQGLGGVVAVVGADRLYGFIDVVQPLDFRVFDVSAEPGGLLLHHHGQFLALHPFGEPRVIVDFVGNKQLTPGAQLLDEQGLHHRPGGV